MKRTMVQTATVLLFVLSTSTAGPADSLFARANEAYRSGNYAAAVLLYDSLRTTEGESAGLYYNLGNARYRSGNIAGAILAYERASRLDPTDDDIQHNLKLAYLRTQDRIEPLPELFIVTWVRRLNATIPVSLTTWLFLAGWIVLFGSLIVMYVVRSAAVIRTSRVSFFAGAAMAVVLGFLLLLQAFLVPEPREGIIVAPTVTSKSSPDPQGADAFVIHEGLKVTLGDAVDEWVRISLADGKTGWIRRSTVEEI